MNEDDIKQENKNIPDKKTSDSQKESSDDKNELSGKIVSVQDNKEKTIQNNDKNNSKAAKPSEKSSLSQTIETNIDKSSKKELKNEENTKETSKGNDKSSKNKGSKLNKNFNNNKNSNNNKNATEESEFIEKLVSINRVAKVVKGGRRFSFAALVVVGDGNGMVGHGKGKAKEVPEAIKKATDEAKARMIRVPLRQARTLHHDITGRYDAGRVKLRSAPSGTGVIAGGPMRSVFEALGIKDIVAKSVGSSNPHNMIRATFDALSSVSSPKLISIRRGLKVNDITKRRKTSSVSQEGIIDG